MQALPAGQRKVVVMGVAGCGKSSVGRLLAQALGAAFVEGDDFHTATARAKMRAGMPLTEADRRPWLAALAGRLAAPPAAQVVACSALRRRHRDGLRAAVPGLRFVFLQLDPATAHARVSRRRHHLFPPSLVADQFAVLEPPTGEPGVWTVDATMPLQPLCARALAWLAGAA